MSELKESILQLRLEGKSYAEIANELNCSKGTISYYCGVGQAEKTKTRLDQSRARIRKLVQDYKQNKGCADCKENYPYWILEFDHTSNDKIAGINTMVRERYPLDVIKKEMEKCEVVCSNCHKNRTWQRTTQREGTSVLEIEKHYT